MMNIDLTNIGIIKRNTFRDCTSLKSISVNDNSSTKVNCKATIDKNSIKQQCDKGLLKNIVLSNSLTAIGNNAFSGCKSLESVELPSNVIIIGENTFEKCEKLEKVNFSRTSSKLVGRKIEAGAFCFCSSLKTIALPNNLELIEEQAFLDCTALKQIEIPENVKEIKDRAFLGCNSLKTVTITAKEPPSLGEKVFPIEGVTFKVPKGSIEKYRNENCWFQYKEMIQEA